MHIPYPTGTPRFQVIDRNDDHQITVEDFMLGDTVVTHAADADTVGTHLFAQASAQKANVIFVGHAHYLGMLNGLDATTDAAVRSGHNVTVAFELPAESMAAAATQINATPAAALADPGTRAALKQALFSDIAHSGTRPYDVSAYMAAVSSRRTAELAGIDSELDAILDCRAAGAQIHFFNTSASDSATMSDAAREAALTDLIRPVLPTQGGDLLIIAPGMRHAAKDRSSQLEQTLIANGQADDIDSLYTRLSQDTKNIRPYSVYLQAEYETLSAAVQAGRMSEKNLHRYVAPMTYGLSATAFDAVYYVKPGID